MYVVIVGGGNVGQYLAEDLIDSNNDVVIIETDEKRAESLGAYFGDYALVLCGDGCDSSILEEAGVGQAKVFVAATGLDDVNLVACEIALRVFGVNRTIARLNEPRNERIFTALGIECVSATQIIAQIIQENAFLSSISVATDLLESKIVIRRFRVGELKENLDYSEDGGIFALDIDMPDDASIICVEGTEGREVVGPDTQVFSNDNLICLCKKNSIRNVRSTLQNLCVTKSRRKAKHDK